MVGECTLLRGPKDPGIHCGCGTTLVTPPPPSPTCDASAPLQTKETTGNCVLLRLVTVTVSLVGAEAQVIREVHEDDREPVFGERDRSPAVALSSLVLAG